MAMQEDTLEVCLQQQTAADGSAQPASSTADMDDIALAHAEARAQACHDCHPPPPSACCHPSRAAPASAHSAHAGHSAAQHGHTGHRPVFHGWQQQMQRRTAQQKHNCAKGDWKST